MGIKIYKMNDKKYIRLCNVAEYVEERIKSSHITLSQYITTDNIEQNKKGIKTAINLPPSVVSLTSFKQDDILIGNIRPYLRKIYYSNKNGGCSQDVLCLRAINNTDSKYLYYNLLSDNFFDYAMLGAKGSKMPRGDKDQIMRYNIPYRNLADQQKIASVLSALDKKIEINNKIIKELEAMSKELYDYWFVQFDFPDKNGKPYRTSGGAMTYNTTLKREIPVGWEVMNICAIARIGSGGTPSKVKPDFWSGEIPFFAPTDYKGEAFIFNTQESITEYGLNKCSSELYKKGDIIITARGSSGKRVIVGKSMAMNQSCYAIIPKGDCSEYVYMLSEILVEALKLKGSGSVFKSITTSDIEQTKLCIAPSKQIELFTKLVRPNYDIISDKIQQNQELATLRDWLLPMLMNGQVTVK